MKHKASILRYLIVTMLAVLCAAVCFTACKNETQRTVTWEVAEHATVKVDGYDALPEKVNEGTELVFTVTCDAGYAVDTVKNGGRMVTARDGKYTVGVQKEDVTISVTVKREVQAVKVSTKPTKLTYYAGETLDKTGMVVKAEYLGGDEETLKESDYRIVYQGGAATGAFALGDTYFKVSYDGKESDNVMLDTAVAVQVTLNLNGATLVQTYQDGIKANTELENVKSENGVFSFTYAKALTADVALPVAADLTKGEEGDYTFLAWKVNGEGDAVSKLSKENAVSVVYEADWSAHLFDFTSIGFEMKDEAPHLVVKGTYRAATSLYMFFTEGNRKISYKAEETVSGTRGQEFTLAVNLMALTTAEAQDGGSFVGPWLDLRFGYDVDGRTESMELPYDNSLETVSMTDEDEIYRFGFAQYEGALKVVITMLTPYTYEMHVDNANDVLTLTIDGKIREKLLSKFTGKTAKMDWWIASTVAAPDATIAADGSFKFEFELSPEKGFVLDTLGYAHFSIVDENGTTLYKDGSDGNLLANERTLTNRDDLEQHNVPHSDFGGVSLMVSNADGTLVYYVGIPNWDAIVIYGLNPKAPKFTSSGQVELKVDNFETPTKVYYVIKITIENLTAEEVNTLLLGNTDGDVNVFKSDAARNSVTGNVYTLWFDVTAYSGSQLWPNLYVEEEDGTYTKMGEFGGDSKYATNGLYAIVNGVKYSILCSSDTWARPCLVTGTPESGETNPPETDPEAVKKEIVIDATTFTLVEDGGKPYVKVTVSANGFANADEIKSSVQYGNFDAHDEGEEDDFEWKTPCAKIETVEDGKYTLWFDISQIAVDKDGRLWSNLFLGNQKIEIKDPAHTSHGKSITVGNVVYTVECTGANQTWDIPCITIKEVGAPEYTATGADLVSESNKVYFVISGTYSGYEKAALTTELSKYFDLQQNDNVAFGSAWDRQVLTGTVTVAESTWEVRYDVTNLGVNAYTAHFGGENTDLKVAKALNLTKECGDKVYTLFSDPKATYGAHFWGCVGLIVTEKDAQPQQRMKMAYVSLEELDGKAYYVLYVSVSGYTADQLKTFKMGADAGSAVQATKIEDISAGVFKMYFDITGTSGNDWNWSHLYTAEGKGYDGNNGDINTDVGVDSLTVGEKTYRLHRGDDSYSIVVWYEDV